MVSAVLLWNIVLHSFCKIIWRAMKTVPADADNETLASLYSFKRYFCNSGTACEVVLIIIGLCKVAREQVTP